ncbi:MAG TPA: VOC family protein [Pirellulales bacterium]|nr:VOC family protein [Pirellulales bacterium]
MQVQPYLNFDGRTEEALDFYRRTIGAEVVFMMRYKESPEPTAPGMVPTGSENKILHSTFRVGDSSLMASDCHCQGKATFEGISLSLTLSDEAKAKRIFEALGEGGQVRMPLTKTFFSPCFGMLADRFGLGWMIYVPGPNG